MKKRIFLSIICNILSILSMIYIIKLGILPNKILSIIVILLIGINIIIWILNTRKKIGFKTIGILMSILLIIGNLGATYFLYVTDNFLNKSFSGKSIETIKYNIVALKENHLTEKDIKGNLGTHNNLIYKKQIEKEIKKQYKVTIKEYKMMNEMYNELLSNNIKFVIVESTSYNVIKEFDKEVKEKTIVIKEWKIQKKRTAKVVKKEQPFNIYIVGADFAGLNDFNMLVTINPEEKKVLLTSIPRDYHIEVVGYGMEDNITYMSALGIDTSIRSLEKLFNTTIDYYVKIDTSSLVNLVDEIGGIEFCSNYSFTTTHAQVIGTYNDYLGKKLYVRKGCYHYNGLETLTIARERKNIPGSDVARQENCRKILMAILNKMKTESVTNYSHLLETLSSSYETTIPRNRIEEIGQDALSSNSKWTISEYIVTGESTIGDVHLGSARDYIMIPNMSTVEEAKTKIHELGK